MTRLRVASNRRTDWQVALCARGARASSQGLCPKMKNHQLSWWVTFCLPFLSDFLQKHRCFINNSWYYVWHTTMKYIEISNFNPLHRHQSVTKKERRQQSLLFINPIRHTRRRLPPLRDQETTRSTVSTCPISSRASIFATAARTESSFVSCVMITSGTFPSARAGF